MSQINPKDLNNQQVAESQCHTKAELKKCTFAWIIDNYTILTARRGGILKSSAFCATNDDFKWHLEHSFTRCGGSTYVAFELRPNSKEEFKKHGSVSGNVRLSVLKPNPNRSKLLTKTCSFTLKIKGSQLCKFSYFADVTQMGKLAFKSQDQLTILCELSYVKIRDIVNVSSPCCSSSMEIPDSSLPRDLGRLYIDDCFKDLTISVKQKNYLVHKAILAIRSSVFDAMFRNDLQGSNKNRIVINDIEEEIFEEMLHYIYTGKTKNLDELAFELLPVADKYDLKELKIMCENVLFTKLSTDNAVKIMLKN
ncbi:speckle-type POZ protein-like isoform X2 [Planococcus citri]|uniref:speckle-type POZ protein-like isoform X2 n=1 Tax=Planococcus citri TaxID=170843 RepID=UPI0031F76CF4